MKVMVRKSPSLIYKVTAIPNTLCVMPCSAPHILSELLVTRGWLDSYAECIRIRYEFVYYAVVYIERAQNKDQPRGMLLYC